MDEQLLYLRDEYLYHQRRAKELAGQLAEAMEKKGIDVLEVSVKETARASADAYKN